MFGDKLKKVEKLAAKKKSDALAGMTNDKDAKVRLAAIAALGSCADDAAYNALIPLVHNDDAAVRTAAIKALGQLGRPAARTHIEHQMAVEKNPDVLAAMQTTLSHIHGKD